MIREAAVLSQLGIFEPIEVPLLLESVGILLKKKFLFIENCLPLRHNEVAMNEFLSQMVLLSWALIQILATSHIDILIICILALLPGFLYLLRNPP